MSIKFGVKQTRNQAVPVIAIRIRIRHTDSAEGACRLPKSMSTVSALAETARPSPNHHRPSPNEQLCHNTMSTFMSLSQLFGRKPTKERIRRNDGLELIRLAEQMRYSRFSITRSQTGAGRRRYLFNAQTSWLSMQRSLPAHERVHAVNRQRKSSSRRHACSRRVMQPFCQPHLFNL